MLASLESSGASYWIKQKILRVCNMQDADSASDRVRREKRTRPASVDKDHSILTPSIRSSNGPGFSLLNGIPTDGTWRDVNFVLGIDQPNEWAIVF
ncbi:hypothetical protein Poly51_58810 [Rubripirellula tenax]|uniref:Uncharacterized protein n=1 Tax=Rubripirellula tenax TaxID=2528015 RepID=A0A5C6E8H6_9BACT|nr:hypothetical protein Poly51_58810 [Rubripirellula tenax]